MPLHQTWWRGVIPQELHHMEWMLCLPLLSSDRMRGYRVKSCAVNKLCFMWNVITSPADLNVTVKCGFLLPEYCEEKESMSLKGHNTDTVWVSLHTKGSGDPSSGCICKNSRDTSQCNWILLCLPSSVKTTWSFLYRLTSRESYLSQTEQWWHRSGFSKWQRSQKRIAEETQAVKSHSRQQQQPLHTLDHRLTNWRGWNELWEPHISLDCPRCSHHTNCTVPPELVRV